MRVIAVIAVRDGAPYVEPLVGHLCGNGVRVLVVDNESTDRTPAIVRRLHDSGLVERYVAQPYGGYFDLSEQLELKERLIADCDADWVLHLDVDELPHSSRVGETLLEGIERADRAGYDVINFDEFVFLPVDRGFSPGESGYPPLRYYYFFAPAEVRLMRAWKPSLRVSNVASGGHELAGHPVRVFPETFVLRHYPFLTQQHAFEKYRRRRFDPSEVAAGWHDNRVGIRPERFTFPPLAELEQLDDPHSHVLSRARPRKMHYWEW